MGKRIALLIGISKYDNQENLAACAKDVEIISTIISRSGCYDDCLTIDTNEKSTILKTEIYSFIKKHKDDEIDEVFFYYTGHGSSIADDFLYLFPDFNTSKLEQTSLRNSELDTMLKSLSAKQTIKVVDACQAGTEYIKSNQDLRTIFEKSSSDSFKKIYFLFSSSSSQPSIALEDFSVFTKSFVMSLLNYENEDIRYRDIMDYISDDANVKKHQTPLFIQQADNIEIFCSVSSDLVNSLKDSLQMDVGLDLLDLSVDMNLEEGDQNSEKNNLVQSIREKSKSYCSSEQAQESLDIYFNEFKLYEWNETISLLFEIKIKFLQGYTEVTGLVEIGKWVKDSDENYFATETYIQEKYQSRERVGSPITSLLQPEYRSVTKYKDVIGGFKLTAETPHDSVVFLFQPKEELLNWYRLFFTHVFSKSQLTVFCKQEAETDLSWDKRGVQNKNTWKIKQCKFKNHESLKQLVQSSINELENEIMNKIKDQFGGE